MNLSHLYYFRKLVEVGSYSKAAEELFIAQPTLSLAVSSLEKELGAPLLKKKRNGVELTEDGEEFYTATLTATNAIDRCTAVIKQRAADEYGALRLGVVYSIQSPEWSRMISQFRRSVSSHIRVDLTQGTTGSLFRDLKAGELDLVFAGIPAGGDPEVTSIPCFKQGVALVVNESNPLSYRKSITLDELVGKQVISYAIKGGPFESELENLLKPHPNLEVRCDFSDEISLCSMVLADPSVVAICSHSWLVSTFPNVKTLEITDAPKDFHQFYMSYRKRGRKALAVEAFLDMAKNYDFINVSPAFVKGPDTLLTGMDPAVGAPILADMALASDDGAAETSEDAASVSHPDEPGEGA